MTTTNSLVVDATTTPHYSVACYNDAAVVSACGRDGAVYLWAFGMLADHARVSPSRVARMGALNPARGVIALCKRAVRFYWW